jgi:hypothetical protein
MILVLTAVLTLTITLLPMVAHSETLPRPIPIPIDGAEVGDIVLLRISVADEVYRPVLVTFVYPSGAIDGELTLRVNGDQFYDWPMTHLAERLNLRNRIIPVLNVVRGNEMGDWKLR